MVVESAEAQHTKRQNKSTKEQNTHRKRMQTELVANSIHTHNHILTKETKNENRVDGNMIEKQGSLKMM